MWRWLHIDWPDWLTTGDEWRTRCLGPGAWATKLTDSNRRKAVVYGLLQTRANPRSGRLTPGQKRHIMEQNQTRQPPKLKS